MAQTSWIAKVSNELGGAFMPHFIGMSDLKQYSLWLEANADEVLEPGEVLVCRIRDIQQDYVRIGDGCRTVPELPIII